MKDKTEMITIEEILKKLLVCAYIIIALLAVITIVLFTSNVKITSSRTDSSNTEENTSSDEEENVDYDVSMFNTVSGDDAVKLFSSEETQVIYIGRSTCGYCVKFLPNLQKAQEEFGYKTNYLDITTVTESQQSALLEKDNDEKFLEENFGSTPMVLLVKDGKIVEGWVGYAEYDSFAQYLTRNGFEKKD